jgi:NTE family protein
MYKKAACVLLTALALNTTKLSAQTTYKNLVLEGGGVRGIAYAGALQALEEKHVIDSMERIAGTSVGSIIATLIAVGYTSDELKDILSELKIQVFNDGHFLFPGGLNRIDKNYGWYRGKRLENYIAKLIEKKTGNADITFKQLHQLKTSNKKYKDLYVAATNLTQQKLTIFSYTNYPDMQLRTAVRASVSIPIYFTAVLLDSNGHRADKKTNSYDVYVDGGIIANYPIDIFDSNPELGNTLGLKLDRPEQIDFRNNNTGVAPYPINSIKQYVGALYNIIIENLNTETSKVPEAERTIYISTSNIQPKIRRVSNEQRTILYNNGKASVEQYFRNK